MTDTTQPTAHAEITAPISADLRGIEQEARECPEPSPTAGMNLGQRILHVGERENAAGYIEFGSVAAVRALVGQVLRDMQAAPPAPAAVAVPDDEFQLRQLDLMQDVLDAKDTMLAAGVERNDFPTMFRQYSALAAASAQEHATQLAGQGQEPAAWRKVERVYREYEGSAKEDTVGRLNTSYSSTKPLHATDWEPLYAAPAQAQEDARTVEPDMFWNMDEPESQHGSIEEFLSDEVSNGFLEAGAVFTMLCACKTPNITIRVTKVDHDECEAEYEVIDATIDAARAAQGGA